jgi:hypothetical protein
MRWVKHRIRGLLASILVGALSLYPLLNPEIILADGNTKPVDQKAVAKIVGQLTVIGAATVNEKKAITGTTIFNNSQIRVACSKGNAAIVDLGKMGRIELTPGAQFVVRLSYGLLSGDLIQGNILVNAPAGVNVSINTPDQVATSNGKGAVVIPVNTKRGAKCSPMDGKTSTSSPTLRTTSLLLFLAGAGAAAAGIVLAATAGNDPAVISPIRH